jgi:hypothetical protein
LEKGVGERDRLRSVEVGEVGSPLWDRLKPVNHYKSNFGAQNFNKKDLVLNITEIENQYFDRQNEIFGEDDG